MGVFSRDMSVTPKTPACRPIAGPGKDAILLKFFHDGTMPGVPLQ